MVTIRLLDVVIFTTRELWEIPMAAIWTHLPDEWGVMQLTEGHAVLRDDACAPVARADGNDGPNESALLVHRKNGNSPLLLCAADSNVLVNGSPTFGIRILADRDEVRVGRQQFYFSAERVVRPEPFAGPDGTRCARCGIAILKETLAAQCGCGLWFHESQDSGCFLYADRCCGCESPTAIDAGFCWSPDGL